MAKEISINYKRGVKVNKIQELESQKIDHILKMDSLINHEYILLAQEAAKELNLQYSILPGICVIVDDKVNVILDAQNEQYILEFTSRNKFSLALTSNVSIRPYDFIKPCELAKEIKSMLELWEIIKLI